MVISQYPAGSSGISTVITSIQRGVAASSGNITISSVNTAKTQVNSFSTAASGTVSATGALSAANGNVVDSSGSGGGTSRYVAPAGNLTWSTTTRSIALNATNLSGGSTNLTSAAFGVYLSNATTLVASGACRYEVIEYV